VTCDGRLFHRRAAAIGNTLSPTVDRRVRRTSRDVDEAERCRVQIRNWRRLLHMSRTYAAYKLTRWQHFSAQNDVMAASLKL